MEICGDLKFTNMLDFQEQNQHLRAAAAHQASIVQSSELRASLISRKKLTGRNLSVAGDML